MDVSIILPVYNVEKYIRPSLTSIVNQTHKNIEIILVDDGSTDSSGAICDEFAEKDSRIIVIHKKNEGTGFARNTGMDAATGEYLYFCDPDDYMDPYLVEDNYKLAKQENSDIIVFGYEKVWLESDDQFGKKKELQVPLLSGTYNYPEFWDHFREECGIECFLNCRMYKSLYITQNKLRHSNLKNGQDAYFVFDTYKTPFDKITYNQKIYYTYIRHEGSSTTIFKPKRIETEYIVSKKYDEVISNCPYSQGRYDDMITRKYVMGMSMAIGNLSRAGQSLDRSEKVKIIKSALKKPEVKRSLKEVRLRAFQANGTKIKILLLKLKLYRCVIWLGELKNRF